MRHILVLLLLSLAGCTLGGEMPPEIPTAPDIPPSAPVVADVAPDLTPQPMLLPAPTLVSVPTPIDAPTKGAAKPVPGSELRAGRQAPAQSPAQLIEAANRTARMAPSPRGYFGGGGVHRYQWTPGRIYDVYLSPTSGTKIVFPPGEVLAHELVLNPDAFDVSMATIGTEVSKSTVIFIRPCAEAEQGCKPATSVDVALVSESGRPYDLHLIVGKVGMVGVTWAIAPIMMLQTDEQPPPPGPGR